MELESRSKYFENLEYLVFNHHAFYYLLAITNVYFNKNHDFKFTPDLTLQNE